MVSKVDKSYTLTLTENEVYTLQVVLGFVAADKECYSVSQKLVDLTGEEMDAYDYDRVVFAVEGCCYGNKIETAEDESIVIRLV
jgi:hypothetical protein